MGTDGILKIVILVIGILLVSLGLRNAYNKEDRVNTLTFWGCFLILLILGFLAILLLLVQDLR